MPIDFVDTDGSFPFRAFGALGGDFWNFRIGRDKLSLGSMGDDNLVVSSTPEWYDYARLACFFQDFEYTGYLIQLDPSRNLYMHRVDFLFFDRLSVGLTEGMLVGEDSPELRFFNPFMIFHGYEAWHDALSPTRRPATRSTTLRAIRYQAPTTASAPCSGSSSTTIPGST